MGNAFVFCFVFSKFCFYMWACIFFKLKKQKKFISKRAIKPKTARKCFKFGCQLLEGVVLSFRYKTEPPGTNFLPHIHPHSLHHQSLQWWGHSPWQWTSSYSWTCRPLWRRKVVWSVDKLLHKAGGQRWLSRPLPHYPGNMPFNPTNLDRRHHL